MPDTVTWALRLSEPRGSLDMEVIKPRAREAVVTAAEQMRQAHAAATAAKRLAQETEAKCGLHCEATYLAWVAADRAAMAAYRSCAAVDIRQSL